MIVKSADDKSKRLALLEDLQQSTRLDARQKEWLTNELYAARQGIAGERDAAHYIDNHYAANNNYMVIHDLRIDYRDEVAQIDHLIIARGFRFYLLETKCYGGNLVINEQGEYAVRYGSGRTYGIPSPMEQSVRHANVLRKLLERLGITGRLRSEPVFEHVVLLHPKAVITRPSAKALDTSRVMKADQFATWHQKYANQEVGVGGVFAAIAELRSSETIKGWAEQLVRLHRPADQLSLPDFMAPKEPVVVTTRAPAAPRVATPAPVMQPSTSRAQEQPPIVEALPAKPQVEKKLICATCGGKISFAEGKFCWGNEKRFGGLQFCREHQAAFAAPTKTTR